MDHGGAQKDVCSSRIQGRAAAGGKGFVARVAWAPRPNPSTLEAERFLEASC